MGKTQESSNKWMDKLCYIHTMEYLLLNKEEKWPIDICNMLNRSHGHYAE